MNADADQVGELTGRTLGQYEIGRLLGEGGMATVYVARQASIGRTVAIKVMPAQSSRDADFLVRFEREVKVIADLQHPRVLPVYDYGQIENRPYIVMAYLSGGTLDEHIKQGPMFLEDTVRLVQQMAEALDYAHGKGVIHRDFKPANVLLDEQDNAHLADFGIARLTASTSNLTGTGVVGTPAYIAPEMLSGGSITHAIDIYALGITLYEMLAGQQPFPSDTPVRIISAHLYDPVPDVRALRPDLPEGVDHVIQRAMAKNPEHRYASAGALAKALSDAAAGRPVTRPQIAERFGPGTRRLNLPAARPPWKWIGGVGALALVVLAILFTQGVFNARPNSEVEPTDQPTPTVAATPVPITDEPTDESSGLPFPVAGEDEVLVIVTDFSQVSVNADTRIYQALAEEVIRQNLTGVRVERLEGVKPLLKNKAIAIGQEYGATLVIWGTADNFSIEPRYEVVRHRNEIQGDISLGVAQGADLSTYRAYLVQNIPNQFEYLMLYILSQIALANHQPQQAVDLLDDAVRIDLGESAADLGLARAYLLQCITYYQTLNQYDKAVEACTNALNVDPALAASELYRGLAHIHLGEDEAGVADLNHALDLGSEPQGSQLQVTGILFLEKGEDRAAEIYFEQALIANPFLVHDPLFFNDVANAYQNVGQVEGSLLYLQQAAEQDPSLGENSYLCMTMGNGYYLLGDYEQALTYYQKALDNYLPIYRDATIEYLYFARAMSYYLKGDQQTANTIIEEGLETAPVHNIMLVWHARYDAITDQNLDQALEEIDAVLADRDLNYITFTIGAMMVYDTRALVYYQLGDYEAALTDANKAVSRLNLPVPLTQAIAYYHRGLIYEALGETDRAVEDYTQYLSLVAKCDCTYPEEADAEARLAALGGEVPEAEATP